jgi:hypothetical protein
MAEEELEALLTDFDVRARHAQAQLDAQRRHLERFRSAAETWLMPLLHHIEQRLERSGHETEVSAGLEAGLTASEPDPSQHVQLRFIPRALPGQRIVRSAERQPLVRFQLDAPEGVVRVWVRDVSLDGREVRVGYRNGEDGAPLGIPVDALDEAFVWRHVLDTVDFALRQSAQEPLFEG